jgi:hypothetical protein
MGKCRSWTSSDLCFRSLTPTQLWPGPSPLVAVLDGPHPTERAGGSAMTTTAQRWGLNNSMLGSLLSAVLFARIRVVCAETFLQPVASSAMHSLFPAFRTVVACSRRRCRLRFQHRNMSARRDQDKTTSASDGAWTCQLPRRGRYVPHPGRSASSGAHRGAHILTYIFL